MIKYSDGRTISVGDSVFIKEKAGCVLRVTRNFVIVYIPDGRFSISYFYKDYDDTYPNHVSQLTKSDMDWGNIPSIALKMAYK